MTLPRVTLCILLLCLGGTAARAEDAVPDDGARAATAAGGDVRLSFNFRYQPWQDVLDWFADQADLSLLLEAPPPGTFNYRDARTYTVAEALDVLNSVLLTKGYTLVRSGRMLVLVDLEDGIPPNLVSDVPLEELDQRGEHELIRVLFPVWNMTPEQAAEEIQPLLGPQGKVVTLPQARQVHVTETAGRLRTIRTVIDAVEQPGKGAAGLREFELMYITFDAAMPTIRRMLGIPSEAYSTPDGSLQISKSATGEKILFRGTAQQAARLVEVLRLIDVPEAALGIDGAPQLEVYPITAADPEAVMKVVQTLLRDDPNVSLATDPQTGYLVAIATPHQQATIRATIEQMQRDARQVDVIALSNVDPQTAVLAINKLFGATGDEADPKAPRVDADYATRSLLVRGTTSQVEQIRDLLRRLGETDGEGREASRQHVRLLPLSGAAARSAIEQIEQIWPSVRTNRIRVVAPSAGIPTYRPSESPGTQGSIDTPENEAAGELLELWRMLREGGGVAPALEPLAPEPPATNGARTRSENIFRFAADTVVAGGSPAGVDASDSPTPPPSPVVIIPGPGGTLIASDDLEALDQLEELLSVVAGRNATSGREYAVFYLKYAKAGAVAEVLAAIFGGRAAGSDRGLVGDLASSALGDVGGALMGDLLLGGGSGGAFTSASIDIVPDARLNALVVHAKPSDLDTVEQLLRILDQRTGPENVEADGQPRPIPVFNAPASEIAQILTQVYQDRIAGSAAVMSPQEMMRMIRGGSNLDQQVQKMSIAVDTRNNLLVVRAPDPLFEEVNALVADLDQTLAGSPETTRVVSLRRTNSAAVQKALTSVLNNVNVGTTTADVRGRTGDESPDEEARRAMRRNWEIMQEMRRAYERMGGSRDSGERMRSYGPPSGSESYRSRSSGSSRSSRD